MGSESEKGKKTNKGYVIKQVLIPRVLELTAIGEFWETTWNTHLEAVPSWDEAYVHSDPLVSGALVKDCFQVTA